MAVRIVVLCLALLLAVPSESRARDCRRLDVPFVSDGGYRNACALGALSSVAGYWGVGLTVKELAGALVAPGRYTTTPEIIALARGVKLWAWPYRGDMADLENKVRQGVPLLVLLDFGFRRLSIPHYAVVTGFDYRRPVIYFHSSWKNNSFLTPAAFERCWARAGRLAFVIAPPDRVSFPLTAVQANDLGIFLSRENRFGEATRFFEQALARENHFLYRFNLACALDAQGEKEKARHLYAEIISENGFAPAGNNLAELILEEDPAEAEKLAREALARDPERGAYYLDTLGRALIARGRIEEGRAAIMEALEQARLDFPELAASIEKRLVSDGP